MHTTEMKMLRWIQGKTRKDRIRNEIFRSDAMVKPITTYATQKRLSWYGHVMLREDTNVAKHITTMKVGGKRPRGRPILRWMDLVRSDLRQHQLDPKLAQSQEIWKSVVESVTPQADIAEDGEAAAAREYSAIGGPCRRSRSEIDSAYQP